MIVILDFGGQYAHLIRRRVRDLGFEATIMPATTQVKDLGRVHGIILSGGPQSVYDAESPQMDQAILLLGIPVLGICYGLQLIVHALGGTVCPGSTKEYGKVRIRTHDAAGTLFTKCPETFFVWMSHGDLAERLPSGFVTSASSEHCLHAAIADQERHIYGVQFHPEVDDTEHGGDILLSFLLLCNAPSWSPADSMRGLQQEIREFVGDRNVFMLVSGGVDSTVAFALLTKTLGSQRVKGLLIDQGLMRKDEVALVMESLAHLGSNNLHVHDASGEFLCALEGVCDPEAKRGIIGDTFIRVQQEVCTRLGFDSDSGTLLGMGTLFPDTIESGGSKHADRIKTHHNRSELVLSMIAAGQVIEPLRDLYKDEVRLLGDVLGLSKNLVGRHPFPGPGLGVRILCATTCPSLPNLGYHYVLPLKSVGVKGDKRSYGYCVALFQTDPFIPSALALKLARSIPNEKETVNRVALCLSQQVRQLFRFTPTTITRDTVSMLQEADGIVMSQLSADGLYEQVWQFPVVLLPCGISPGARSIMLRPVISKDAMTAHVPALPSDFLQAVTEQLLQVSGIDAVFLDLTSKPPGTIEWE